VLFAELFAVMASDGSPRHRPSMIRRVDDRYDRPLIERYTLSSVADLMTGATGTPVNPIAIG